MPTDQDAEVRIRRYTHVPGCDVVVAVRGKEVVLRCPDYDQALKWAWLECKSYRVTGIGVDRIHKAE
jgi:hypothetical protein